MVEDRWAIVSDFIPGKTLARLWRSSPSARPPGWNGS
jgi:hypothetical protein